MIDLMKYYIVIGLVVASFTAICARRSVGITMGDGATFTLIIILWPILIIALALFLIFGKDKK